jgi:hypothetical protein
MSAIKRYAHAWLSQLMAAQASSGSKTVGWCLVEYINPHHGRLNPSISTIGRRIRLSERHVRRHIHDLQSAGWLGVEKSQGGAPSSTNGYHLLTPDVHVTPTPDVHVTPDAHDHGHTRPQPLARASVTPDVDVPRSQKNPKEPKEEVRVGKNRRTRASPTRCSEDFQPDEKSVAWIESFGVTLDDAKPAIHEFAAYWSERSTKRADWQATFRKSGKVEGFLLKLKQRAGKNGGNGTVPAWRLSEDELAAWAESRGIGAKPGEEWRSFRARVEPTYEQERAK